MSDVRLVKVPMPVGLIRRMDEALVRGQGGFTTRAEFLREAAENLLVELTYDEAPPEPGARPAEARAPAAARSTDGPPGEPIQIDGEAESPVLVPLEVLDAVPTWEREELRLEDLAGSALRLGGRGVVAENGVAVVEPGPLLGLHNRDYPSLWAAYRLARYTNEDLLPFREFVDRATNAAWVFAAGLQALERAGRGERLTALFPTNPAKRAAAERAFQNFAVGAVPRRLGENRIRVSGPLFVWGVCQLVWRDDELLVGLTGEGWELLEDLQGLSLRLPHEPLAAERFLAHLGERSPGDRWGFDRLLALVAEEPDRETLVGDFTAEHPEWTAAMKSSVVQGYVARGREWGLLEPRLHEGRYRLAEFGSERLEKVAERSLTPVREEGSIS